MNEFEMKQSLMEEHSANRTSRFKDSLDDIKRKVFWEANSAVKRNRNIDPKQIISKCSTNDFPEGVTVRTHRMKDGFTSAYFHGDVEKKYWESLNGKTYFNSIGKKLIVGFPYRTKHGGDWGFSFNGNLDAGTSFSEMGQTLSYIRSELNAMYNNGN